MCTNLWKKFMLIACLPVRTYQIFAPHYWTMGSHLSPLLPIRVYIRIQVLSRHCQFGCWKVKYPHMIVTTAMYICLLEQPSCTSKKNFTPNGPCFFSYFMLVSIIQWSAHFHLWPTHREVAQYMGNIFRSSHWRIGIDVYFSGLE